MHTGELRSSVTIESVTETQDSAGGVVQTWATFAQVWAKIEPIRGREFFDAQIVQADLSHRITIRYLANVTPKMRIVHGATSPARVFEITAVMDGHDGQTWLELMCVEKGK